MLHIISGLSCIPSVRGGASLWSEDKAIGVVDGVVSTHLGSVSSFPATLFNNPDLYLQICFDANGIDADSSDANCGAGTHRYEEIFGTRKQVTAVPVALRAKGLVDGTGTPLLVEDIFRQGGNTFGVTAVLGTKDANSLQLITNDTAAMTILANGNVGVGTASPGQKLSVNGTFGIVEGGVSPQYYTVFQGGDQTSNITYTLPTTIGLDGQVLGTDGSGVLSWVNGGTGGGGSMFNTNGSVLNGDYIEIAHNTNTYDLLSMGWYQDAITGAWKQLENVSKSITHDLFNEFNPAFTQKLKTSSVALNYNEHDFGTGADGAITVTVNTSINTTNLISGRSCVDGGDAVNYSVTGLTATSATLESTPSAGCLAIGDEVLLINLRGTTSAYGNVGNYETLRVSSIVGSTVNFTTAKSKYYGDGASDDTNIGVGTGAQAVMLQRVPNYTNVTVNASISFYPDVWAAPTGAVNNGAGEGGVMFFRANGAVAINGTLTAAARGYRGGTYQGDLIQQLQGESTSGSGAQTTNFKAQGGGGGGGAYCSGGGGGGYTTAGVAGIRAGTSCTGGGSAGPAYPPAGNATLAKLYFGSGGGSGGTGYLAGWTYDGGAGGAGGGVVYVAANSITVSGAATANGAAGGSVGDLGGSDIAPGGGGGGAGGSLKFIANTVNLGAGLTTAAAGAGGTTGYSTYGATYADLGGYSHGGAGGVGVVSIHYTTTLTGTSSPTYTASMLVYNTYATFHSSIIETPKATSYGNISWTENLATHGEIQFQTRSGASLDPTDGTWEAWGPTSSRLELQSTDTHTDWIGTNATVAEGDIKRDVIYYEDEDENTSTNITKSTNSAANGYVEATIGAANVSTYDYITFWVRSSTAGNKIKIGLGESLATEQEEVVTINSLNTWQKVYWDISDIAGASRDAVTKLRITGMDNGQIYYIDSIRAESFLTATAGSAITSTANKYLQYRVILSTTNTAYTPNISAIRIGFTNPSGTYQLDGDRTRAISDISADTSIRFIATEYELDENKSTYTRAGATEVGMSNGVNSGSGADGDITVTVSTDYNTTNLISGRTCADGGDAVNYSVIGLTSLTATLESVPSAGCLAVGDEILLINLQGTVSATGNIGNYETLRVNSQVGNVITFTTAKTKYYGDGATDDSNIGIGVTAQTVMLQRVPNYRNITINAGVSFVPSGWVSRNGTVHNGAGEGGVMFFRASGAAVINGTISAAGRGYIAGTYQGHQVQHLQGESTTGAGGLSTVAKAEGGGGGSGGSCSGGGGGGYATAGGIGNRSGTGCSTAGAAGPSYPSSGNGTLTKLYFGSAGGAGGTGYNGTAWTVAGGAGGNGGGIVYIAANSVTVSGAINANGVAGTSIADIGGADIAAGGGGGGAGGSIKIVGSAVNVGSGITTASGGAAGSTGLTSYTGSTVYSDISGYAYGGAGSTGIIAVQAIVSLSGSSTPAYSVTQEATSNFSLFVSDEIATPNAVSYKTISWLADLSSYGLVELQTRSGPTSNSTDGTWEAWKPFITNTNTKVLNSMDTHTDWTVSNLNAAADGDVTRNVDYFEDEDELTVGNTTKFSSAAATNGYAEDTITSTDLSSTEYIVAWVRSSAIGNVIKLGIGESAATENEEIVYVSKSNTWQKVYWDISDIDKSQRDAVTKLRISILSANTTVYVDSLTADTYLQNASGSAITSSPNEYIQYRAVITTTNSVALSPKLHNVHIDWNDGYKIVQVDANTTRLYNMTGQTQNMRLVVGSGVGSGGGSCTTCFENGGNTFAADATLGTADAYDLVFITNNVTRFAISDTGVLTASGDLLPGADDTYDLGSSSARWQDLFLGPASLHITSIIAETTTARDWNLGIIETDGATEGNFTISEGINAYLTVSTTGNIGVGTTNPGQKLTVEGTLGILEGGAAPQYHTVFQGGDQTADITYTLPTAVGGNGQVLGTDASGNLSWIDDQGGVLYTASDAALASGSYVTVAHNKNTNDLLTTAWVYSQSTWKQLDATYKPAIAWEGKNTQKGLYHDSINQYSTVSVTSQNLQTMIAEGLLFDSFEDSNKYDASATTVLLSTDTKDNGMGNYLTLTDRSQFGRVGLWGGQTASSSTTDTSGNAYLGNNATKDMFYYERATIDSIPAVQVELGIDPNWYNGVSLIGLQSQSGTVSTNTNLTTKYNGSLIKVSGRYSSNARSIDITIRSASTFDWTDDNGNSATGVTIQPNTTQILGSTGVSVVFSNVAYNIGDVFRVASWYTEPESATRGEKQQFPERAHIITTQTSVDIIDADTQKVWMRFTDGNNNLIYSAAGGLTGAELLNGILYVGENVVNGQVRRVYFATDRGDTVHTTGVDGYNGSVAQRNGALGNASLSRGTGVKLVSGIVNDIVTAVIPNATTQEVTVSGWGYIAGDSTDAVEETISLPYQFNNIPEVVVSYAGAMNGTPSTIANCVSPSSGVFQTSATSTYVNKDRFVVNLAKDGSTFTAGYSWCYTWTATGSVSPKQFAVAASGSSTSTGGVTIINETEERTTHLMIGSQLGGTAAWSTKVALGQNELYAVRSYGDVGTGDSAIFAYYGLHGLRTETSWAQYRHGQYRVGNQFAAWSTNGPVIYGNPTGATQITSLSVSKGTSTNYPGHNTIYVGTTSGLSAINEVRGNATTGDGIIESFGSVKYYRYNYISEELVGDIRGAWSFSHGTDSSVGALTDVTVKGFALSLANGGTGTGIGAAVRNYGLSVSGAGGYAYCTDANCGGTGKLDIIAITNAWTAGAWVKTSSSTRQSLLSKGTTNDYSYELEVASNALCAVGGAARYSIYQTGVGQPYVTACGTTSLSDGKWHHVVGVWDGATLSLYVDGVLQGSSSTVTGTPNVDSAAPFAIAGRADNANYLNGVIDEPFVTATAISGLKVKQMYEVGKRALESHNTSLGRASAESNQEIGGSVNTVGFAQSDTNNQYIYVGTNNTSSGVLAKIQVNSDTNIKSYTSSANTPAGGVTLVDEDVTTAAIGADLYAVGSAASGVKLMGTTGTTGDFVSKTYTLSKNIGSAVLWVSPVTDGDDVSNVIAVKASNDGGSTYATCTLVSTDSLQTVPELEYACEFSAVDNDLKVKFEFARTSTKTSTYIVQYGISWLGESGFRLEQADTNTVRLYNFTGETQNVRLGVTGGGFEDVAILWTDGGSYIRPANNESLRIYDAVGTNYAEIGHDGTNATLGNNGTASIKIDANGHVLPASDNTRDLGSNVARWRDLYLGPNSLNISSTVAETSVAGNWSISILGSPIANPGSGEGGLAFKSSSTTIMTLLQNGRVGIGTVDPTEKLGIVGNIALTGNLNFSSANPYINASSYFYAPGGAYFNSGKTYFAADAEFRGGISNDTATTLTIYGGTESKVYFPGYVGIGTTDPGAQLLEIVSDVTTLPINFVNNNTSSGVEILRLNMGGKSGAIGTTVEWLQFAASGTVIDSFEGDTTGGVRFTGLAAGTYSDRRLKENITPYSGDALSFLENFETVTFNFKDGTNPMLTRIGFIAQDVLPYFPQAVNFGDDLSGIPEDQLPRLKLDYGQLTPILAAAIKQQQMEIKDIERSLRSGIMSLGNPLSPDVQSGTLVYGEGTSGTFAEATVHTIGSLKEGQEERFIDVVSKKVQDTFPASVGNPYVVARHGEVKVLLEEGLGNNLIYGDEVTYSREVTGYAVRAQDVPGGVALGKVIQSVDWSTVSTSISPSKKFVLATIYLYPRGSMFESSNIVADAFWSEISPTAIQTSRDIIAANITGTRGQFSLLNSMTLNINDSFLVDDQGNAVASSVSTPLLKGFGSGLTLGLESTEAFNLMVGNQSIFAADVEGIKVSGGQAGVVTLAAGQTSIVVSSPYIKDGSIVLVTPSVPISIGVTTNGTNKTFTVSTTAPMGEDVTLRWFVVNNTSQ